MPETPQAYDPSNHEGVSPATAWTAAAHSTSAAGTVIPVEAGAGTGATTAIGTGQRLTDNGGKFNLTAAGTPAAGKAASGFFVNAYSSNPLPFGVVSITDTTDSTTVAGCSLVVSATGWDLYTPALVAAKVYEVDVMIRQP